MTQLKFLGGIGEIGGNKILVEEDEFRIFLDFGLSFGIKGMYYDNFLQARGFAIIDEYVDFGMLPRVKGIYREDHLIHSNPNHPLLDKGGEKSVEAVLISHAHMDHVGLIPYLRSDIELLGSELTERIIIYYQDAYKGVLQEYLISHPKFKLISKKTGTGMKRAKKQDLGDEKRIRKYKVLSQSNSSTIGDFEIDIFPVDHSLPGASAYIIKTPSGNIAYTGDLRFHGYQGDRTQEYVKALENSDIRMLLCEGTRAPDRKGTTEESLKTEMISVFSETTGLVLIYYPPRDTSRLKTISDAATACGRKLVVNPKQAYYLNILNNGNSMDPLHSSFEILMPRKSWGIWGDKKYDEEQQLKDYTSSILSPIKEFIFSQSNLVTPNEIHTRQNEYVVTCSFYELGLLHDLKPNSGSIYIWSRAEPFDEEGAIDYERVTNWLNHFQLGAPRTMHCSGHLSGPEIKELIERAQPEIVVPIHTQEPNLFKNWHDDVRIVQLAQVLDL